MKTSIVRMSAVLLIVASAFLSVQGVASSANPSPVTADQAFVVAASHDFLGRAPTRLEQVTDAAARLDTAAARSAVVSGMAASPEYVEVTVGNLYSTALGRTGDAGGIAYWSHLVETHRMSVASVAATLYSSNEYYRDLGLSNDRYWVVVLYDKLLSRDGVLDRSGVNYWTALVQRVGRYRVARALYQSNESRHDRVAARYRELLGRGPDLAGWDYWSAEILRRGDLRLATALASSEEYYERAFARYHDKSVPTEPTGVVAVPGTARAIVFWTAPDWIGGSAISGYTVTASPGGQTCTTTGARYCTVSGLNNGTAYTFAVTATNEIGTSAPSAPSAAVTPTLLGWSPPPGAIPNSGTVLYLQSDSGDYIGLGNDYLYTLANSQIGVSAVGSQLHFTIKGDQNWSLIGTNPPNLTALTTGYWQGLNRSEFDFSGDGRGCNTESTDLQIDDVVYDSSGVLQRYTMRFLQHCEGGSPALRGYFRYDASDPTTPPPPGDPADFAWHPPSGAVPATGNYLYLQGSPGDFISGGQTLLFGPSTTFGLSNTYGRANDVSFGTSSGNGWDVEMFGKSTQSRLTTGLYTNVESAPFNNPTTGGFSISGNGRGCNNSFSTFAVDQISYDSSGTVSSISARFVQHCEQSTAPPLYGALRFG